jgi:predicted nucleic acid-binding protein
VGAILDTSFFIAREQGRQIKPSVLPDGLALSVVTLAELRLAVLNENDTRRQATRLDTLERALRIRPIGIDETIAFQWAVLRSAARSQSQRRVNDLWIAATAVALGVPVVTQDEGFVALMKIGGPETIMV